MPASLRFVLLDLAQLLRKAIDDYQLRGGAALSDVVLQAAAKLGASATIIRGAKGTEEHSLIVKAFTALMRVTEPLRQANELLSAFDRFGDILKLLPPS